MQGRLALRCGLVRIAPQRIVQAIDIGGNLHVVHRSVPKGRDRTLDLVVARAGQYDEGNSERRGIAAVVGQHDVERNLTAHFGGLLDVVRGFDGKTFVCKPFAERFSHTF